MVVQQIVHKLPPNMMCQVKEGCENAAEGTCSIINCCSDWGCGKKVCNDCRSKHCQLNQQQRGAYQPTIVCLDCEPKVLKKVKCTQALFMIPYCTFLAFFCLMGPLSFLWRDYDEEDSARLLL